MSKKGGEDWYTGHFKLNCFNLEQRKPEPDWEFVQKFESTKIPLYAIFFQEFEEFNNSYEDDDELKNKIIHAKEMRPETPKAFRPFILVAQQQFREDTPGVRTSDKSFELRSLKPEDKAIQCILEDINPHPEEGTDKKSVIHPKSPLFLLYLRAQNPVDGDKSKAKQMLVINEYSKDVKFKRDDEDSTAVIP